MQMYKHDLCFIHTHTYIFISIFTVFAQMSVQRWRRVLSNNRFIPSGGVNTELPAEKPDVAQMCIRLRD